ncbi:Exodeoxyribonuclease III [hydrothermal vent metagenome]|uniref:Exodeoxyribonuclease III n=1 Tax=hydrothermal vent metagenome TaxID=652676 RepID=A0A3B0TPQ9_9ZZZZ
MTLLKIATWNINSVRLRIGLVEKFLTETGPDILCLQETKCPNDKFPTSPFKALGYEHVAYFGQKGYHGVATVSRIPFDTETRRDFCAKGDARHLATTVSGNGAFAPLTVHNFYVPAGGDVPDVGANPKFAHKLDFLDEMTLCFAAGGTLAGKRQVLVGDLNVAPHENDVWSHKQLLKVVSHTPIEVEKLDGLQALGGWHDVVREHIPTDTKLFTWWSYRSRDWRLSNRGRRLDHIWASTDLKGRSKRAFVIDGPRDWDRPSDHAPVLAEFDVS